MCREPSGAILDLGHPEPVPDNRGWRPLERIPVREA